ncbi:MAG: DUF192 domain-containing protein [Myxococcota bacterium]
MEKRQAQGGWSRRQTFRLLGWLVLPLMWSGCADAAVLETIPLQVGGQTLTVEVAISQAEQARGLMYRKSMPESAGMLFVYPVPQPVAYWMKNTYLPLSIAFIDSSHKIVNMSDMAPNNETKTYPSYGPVQYVLEVNQGYFEKHGIKPGDVVTFTLPEAMKKRVFARE